MTVSPIQLWVDCDNALGAARGDIDDGLAIMTLHQAGIPLLGVSSVFGNTSAADSHVNNQKLFSLLGQDMLLVSGAAAPLAKCPPLKPVFTPAAGVQFDWLSLGPLTNLANFLHHGKARPRRTIVLCCNWQIPLPTCKFFDFNLALDSMAFRRLLASPCDLTIVPCNVARRLRLKPEDIRSVPSSLREWTVLSSARWFRRARRLKWQNSVPAWDLVAALYFIFPELFVVETSHVSISRYGRSYFHSKQGRPVSVVTEFDADVLKQRMLQLWHE